MKVIKIYRPLAGLLTALAIAVPAQSSANSAVAGEPESPSDVPSSFGPFRAKSTSVGIYRGNLNLKQADLGQKLFMVVRTQADKTHKFGWIRVFVNNQLVATEQSLKENRIVENISKWLRPGATQISIVGAAYPDTAVDFHVVPEGDLSSVLQSNPFGTTIGTAGPFRMAADKQEKFTEFFNLTAEQARAKLTLNVKTAPPRNKRFSWLRVNLNGTLVASEQKLRAGETTVDIDGFAAAGPNKIEVSGVASAPAAVGCYIKQLPVPAKPAASSPAKKTAHDNVPKISKLDPSAEAAAGQTLTIHGSNFESSPPKNVVYFDGTTAAAPSGGTASSLTVEVPKELPGGQAQVNVVTPAGQSNAISIAIKGLPVVRSTSPALCAPGSELEIRGDNFPERISQVKVLFGSCPGRVLQATRDRLLVIVPELPPDTMAPLKVLIGRLQSNNDVFVKISAACAGDQ